MRSQLDLTQRFLCCLDRLQKDPAAAAGLESNLWQLIKGDQLALLKALEPVADKRLAEAFQLAFFPREAFEALIFRRYHARMLKWCGDLPPPLDPEDLRADVTVHLLDGALARYEGSRGPFGGWLMAVCRNQRLDLLRRRRLVLADLTHLPSPPATPGPSPPEAAEVEEEAAAVNETLGELEPADQTVAQLRLSGHTFEEIGPRAGVSTSNAWGRWQRIQAMLQILFQLRFGKDTGKA